MGRFLRWAIGMAVSQTVLLWVLAWLIPGFSLSGIGAAVVGAITITVALAIAWPFIYYLSARLHPILFPILTFGLTGVVVFLVGEADDVIEGVVIDSVWDGIWITLGLTIGNVIIGALFSLNDDFGYEWFVVRPMRRSYASTPKQSTPGILYLEIDGLAEPILRRAIDGGYMPTLERWINSGSHQLLTWEPDLSSQTSASQAGILLGDNTEIPAFRWYDKPLGKLMVTSKLATTTEVEHRLSTGAGLLADGGASRWNVFSGDATDCLCTFSAVGDKKRTTSRSYVAYFSNPYTFSRTLALFFGDVGRELWEARAQVRRDEQPRIHRKFKYAFIRSSTTTVMQEASRFMLTSDMFRGVPAVYNTFFAYDEVAHHSGIDRRDAFKVLSKLDRVFAGLERAAALAPRPYHFVVLSDHGQSMGATFKQRYGYSLSDLVERSITADHEVTAIETSNEDVGLVNLALTEASRQDARTARLLKRALQGQSNDEQVDISSDEDDQERAEIEIDQANVVVVASGNLGLISFPGWKERMTYEQLVDVHPRLLPSLVEHEGVGFVMVRSENDGGVVIGRDGFYYLDLGYAAGTNPLEGFGANAARHLARTNGFANAPDILVNSLYAADTGEVAAFEELVGSHGGLGGTQTQPFVLHPSALATPGEPIVGAAALHSVLKNWRQDATSSPAETVAIPRID